MKTMTIIDNGTYVVFLDETGQEGLNKAEWIIKNNPKLEGSRIIEAVQYAPGSIVPGIIYDRENGIPWETSIPLWDGKDHHEDWKKEQEPPTRPHPIDGPGWYRTASGDQANVEVIIQDREAYEGYIDGVYTIWNQDGTEYSGDGARMIVAKA